MFKIITFNEVDEGYEREFKYREDLEKYEIELILKGIDFMRLTEIEEDDVLDT